MSDGCHYCDTDTHGNHDIKCPYSTVFYSGTKYVPESAVTKARAEVLAACIAELKKLESEATKNEAYGIRKACQTLAYVFRQLQPAAADLEELLRKGRLEEHKAVCADCNAVVEADWPKPTKFKLPKPCQRLAELEKARAILNK